jgi:hypothetical protein
MERSTVGATGTGITWAVSSLGTNDQRVLGGYLSPVGQELLQSLFVRTSLAFVALVIVLVLGASAAPAHMPGSDGGPGKKTCRSLSNVSFYGPVGVAVTRVPCGKARRVARKAVRRTSAEGIKWMRIGNWRCTGMGTRFGHCHFRYQSARIIHWYADH